MKRTMLVALLVLPVLPVLLVLLTLPAGCDGTVDLPPNNAPIARVVVPQLWPAGEPALIDPTLSEDPDDDALAFTATFGDGTAQATGDDVFEHVYGAPGSFAVEIVATDGDLQTRVESRIVVVGDDSEACSCDAPCLEEGICAEGACVLFASSDPDETSDARPPLDGELSCE